MAGLWNTLSQFNTKNDCVTSICIYNKHRSDEHIQEVEIPFFFPHTVSLLEL